MSFGKQWSCCLGGVSVLGKYQILLPKIKVNGICIAEMLSDPNVHRKMGQNTDKHKSKVHKYKINIALYLD